MKNTRGGLFECKKKIMKVHNVDWGRDEKEEERWCHLSNSAVMGIVDS